ncbi:MAG: TfoX/Sxy family protein [Calditrichia bacterium]|nr:TfoX/Sxy family protein [Calditrichia bacterium]
MGKKGAKLSNQATEVYDRVIQTLASPGNVTGKKMFGGYGIFESGSMFALIDSRGKVFLKVNDTNRGRFEEIRAESHGKMPYYEVSTDILDDDNMFMDWAKFSIQIAHKNRKK